MHNPAEGWEAIHWACGKSELHLASSSGFFSPERHDFFFQSSPQWETRRQKSLNWGSAGDGFPSTPWTCCPGRAGGPARRHCRGRRHRAADPCPGRWVRRPSVRGLPKKHQWTLERLLTHCAVRGCTGRLGGGHPGGGVGGRPPASQHGIQRKFSAPKESFGLKIGAPPPPEIQEVLLGGGGHHQDGGGGSTLPYSPAPVSLEGFELCGKAQPSQRAW